MRPTIHPAVTCGQQVGASQRSRQKLLRISHRSEEDTIQEPTTQDLGNEEDRTLIVVTHDPCVAEYAEKTVVLGHGRLARITDRAASDAESLASLEQAGL
jgi:ABC-type lipoprotein export system ATPase subunit